MKEEPGNAQGGQCTSAYLDADIHGIRAAEVGHHRGLLPRGVVQLLGMLEVRQRRLQHRRRDRREVRHAACYKYLPCHLGFPKNGLKSHARKIHQASLSLAPLHFNNNEVSHRHSPLRHLSLQLAGNARLQTLPQRRRHSRSEQKHHKCYPIANVALAPHPHA